MSSLARAICYRVMSPGSAIFLRVGNIILTSYTGLRMGPARGSTLTSSTHPTSNGINTAFS